MSLILGIFLILLHLPMNASTDNVVWLQFNDYKLSSSFMPTERNTESDGNSCQRFASSPGQTCNAAVYEVNWKQCALYRLSVDDRKMSFQVLNGSTIYWRENGFDCNATNKVASPLKGHTTSHEQKSFEGCQTACIQSNPNNLVTEFNQDLVYGGCHCYNTEPYFFKWIDTTAKDTQMSTYCVLCKFWD